MVVFRLVVNRLQPSPDLGKIKSYSESRKVFFN